MFQWAQTFGTNIKRMPGEKSVFTRGERSPYFGGVTWSLWAKSVLGISQGPSSSDNPLLLNMAYSHRERLKARI
jgi:hypothetical protein